MRAYQTRQLIPESHTLTVQLPPEVPAGPAEVIVLYQDDLQPPRHMPVPVPVPVSVSVPVPASTPLPSGAVSDVMAQDLAGFLDLLNQLPAREDGGRTREDIDRQIELDRDAWA
ncbi:MAG: hypothetical protein RLZZ584_4128 [Pseudomonadota bacterium]